MNATINLETRARLLVTRRAANPAADPDATLAYVRAVVAGDDNIDELANLVAATGRRELIERFVELVPNATEPAPGRILIVLDVMEDTP